MASFNTFFDSANTAVRAFLTKVGGLYNDGRKFDTTVGDGIVARRVTSLQWSIL